MVQHKNNFTLTPQQLADLMVTAFEGGSNYWIESVRYQGKAVGSPWYSDPSFYEKDFTVYITTDDGDTYELNNYIIQQSKTPERVVRDLEDDMMDAETADIWLQNALFGEIIYG